MKFAVVSFTILAFSFTFLSLFELGISRDTTVMRTGALGGVDDKGPQNDAVIESIAQFAVEEHNKKENTLLKFSRVVKAQEQVVSGKMYYITLEAIDSGKCKVYEAQVSMKPWMHTQQLEEFKAIQDTSATCTDHGANRGP